MWCNGGPLPYGRDGPCAPCPEAAPAPAVGWRQGGSRSRRPARPALQSPTGEGFLRRWPDWQRYGLSTYFAEDDDAVADLAADQLKRFPLLRLYDPAVLTAAGLEVVPTFRSPHVTLAFVDLDAGLAALETAEHETRLNPYHEW